MGRPDVEDREGQFLYSSGDTYTFMDPATFEQVEISADMLGDAVQFLIDGMNVSILFIDGKAVSVDLPNHVALTVTQCDPASKGDTVQGALKKAILETGLQVMVPLFMKEGEKVKVDTRTGEYLERA